MTEIPESLRKAYRDTFGYGLWEDAEKGLVSRDHEVLQIIAAQREEAVREVIEELDAQSKRWGEEIKKGPCVTEDDEGNEFDWQRHAHHKQIAYITASVHLRDKFLPTSLTPEKDE